MEQIQKQKSTRSREVEAIDEAPAIVDETVINLSTERVLGNIALALG